MKKTFAIPLLLMVVTACSAEPANDAAAPAAEGQATGAGQVSGEAVAETLEDAASQSGPAAQEVLEDAADVAKGQESLPPVSEPGSFAQDAMQAAGNAQSRADQGNISAN